MSAPLVPSPLDFVGRRRFAFYPPIRHSGPNLWFLQTGSWSEVQVINVETNARLWIPRQYVQGVSDNGCDLVVELTKDLQHQQGAVYPLVKRVIEMPHSGEAELKPLRKRRRRGPAPVVGIRIETEEPVKSKVLAHVALGVVAVALFLVLAAVMGRV